MNLHLLNNKKIFNIHTDGIPFLSVDLLGDHIAVSNVCTKCNADHFYSFRAHRMENEQAAMIVNRFA